MNRMFQAALLLVGVSVAAQAAALAGVTGLSSGYLIEEQVNYRLSFPQSGKVGVQRDTNRCSVDAYGRANGCTRMFLPIDEYDAKELSAQDGLTLFELTPELRLVLQRTGLGGASAFLLKVNARGEVEKRIPLYADVY